jgi:PAS domain S-box-containing protein
MDFLLDTAPCGFVALADDGTILEVNATLAALLGYAKVELHGWHLQKILPPGGRIFYQTHVFPLLKLQGHVEELYVPLRSKDGADVPMLMNGVRRERDGIVVNDCVFVRMLQRHQFEDQLVQARRLAEEANASKAAFLSMMSHDLRGPLTAISGHARLLSAGLRGALNEEQQDGVARIEEAGQDLLFLINDILDFARLEAGRVEVRLAPVPVSAAIGRAERLVRLRFEEEGLDFAGGCDGETAVLADPDRLQQILLNLLTNAIKFTPRGGRVRADCERDGERVRIRVADTGIGIPPSQLGRIFDPFVQLDGGAARETPVTSGVGLGLAISRNLARAMNGDLTVESEPGTGSVFTVDLPASTGLT